MKSRDAMRISILIWITVLSLNLGLGTGDNWGLERGWAKDSVSGHGKLSALDVICGKDHMTVRAEFNGPFNGIIFSKGTYGQDDCVYLKQYSATTHATFKVRYDKCGTKPDLQGKYYENTIVIQYGTDIIEAWDEAKRLRCEWFEAYEKPATFRPAIPVADLDVVEMNFQGDDIDCWMEIQEGKGPWGREVSRIVPVGQPMTIVIAINDFYGQFDMRVKSCFAHDGVKTPIHLTDEHGCVLRPKMLTPFNKVRDSNGRATIISYSHFYAFKFPDSMNVQIQCTVEVCRHGCPDACQKGAYPAPHREIQSKVTINSQQPPAQSQPPHPAEEEDLDPIQHVESRVPQSIASPPNEESSFKDSKYGIGFDLKRLTGGNQRNNSTQSEDQKNEDNRDKASSNAQDSHEEEKRPTKDEAEANPIVKVLEIDIPVDNKKPTITEQTPSNLSPEDIKHASKFLTDLGLNIDLKNLANKPDFMERLPSKDIAELLKNEKLNQLAMASGINLNQASFNPQALIAAHGGEKLGTKQHQEHQNAGDMLKQPNYDQMQNSGHFNHTPSDSFKHYGNPFAQMNGNVQEHKQRLHPQMNPELQEKPNHPDMFPSQPVGQVMNVPLQLGVPPPLAMPPTNLMAQLQQLSLQKPNLLSSHPLAKAGLSLLQGGKNFFRKPLFGYTNNDVRQAPFPHGPRSLRYKRSNTGSQISVTKQFQVVTSIDLSFAPNATDVPQLFEGRRELMDHSICMPLMQLAFGVTIILSVIFFALGFAFVTLKRIRQFGSKAISS